MTKTNNPKKIIAAFLFAFCCCLFRVDFVSAQDQPPTVPLIHPEEQVLPDQFQSNDSLNEVDNGLTNSDSLQEGKISFADVDVPTFEDSIYKARLEAISTVVPLLYNQDVKRYIDLYVLNRRDQVSRMLGLSRIYFPLFDDIFTQYGVPTELKYLSIIESALNPQAVSRAGAVGMWQFMFGTAKLYGLNINSYIDERRDIIRSTEGAAQYLKTMYDVYGDWLLAIASYNCGPGNVNRAISLSGGNNFWDIKDYLPRETRNYVPAFIAATYVMNYYDLHDLCPEFPKYNFDSITTVNVEQRMACEQIAKFTGLSLDEFKFLNPGLKCSVIPGGPVCSYACKLPFSSVCLFDEKRDSIVMMSKNVKSIYYPGYRDGSRFIYTVRKGDNLGHIAAKFHVTVSQLKSWNRMQGSTIHAGQHLKIYGGSGYAKSSSKATHKTAVTADSKKTNDGDKTATAGNKIDVKPASIPLKENHIIYYKARSGDTLWDIAQRHGTTVAEIKKLNGAAKCNNLKAGTVLKLSSKG